MTKLINIKKDIWERPEELLQNLIRYNTTNPPGNESECIAYIDNLLKDAGLKTHIFAKDSSRPNLVTRLKGQGSAPPLLLYGHVDVVTTADQDWTVPPFDGKIAEGYVWGRGALDMKGGIAMMLAAVLKAKAKGIVPAGDIVLAILSDEEAGGDYGAKYLVENHAEYFEGICYAIGEFGGFPIHVVNKKFYAVQVAEKQLCSIKLTIRGLGGHGSFPMHGGAMARLAGVLKKLDQYRLPVHITPVASQMLEKMAETLPLPMNEVLAKLLDPDLTDSVLDQLGPLGVLFDAMLHNTVNATIVHGGKKINVIPSAISLELDGRLLPGFTPNHMIQELRQVIGDNVEIEIVRHDAGPSQPDMAMFTTLADILREAVSDAIPVPLLLLGVTDARFFSRLGIQTYGFLPMNLPEDFDFMKTIHAADERIPIESVIFGTNAIYELLKRYKALRHNK
jgi:acetylornithine deacetylase/succinyl-diaminopimelate desuccinylase-like protein